MSTPPPVAIALPSAARFVLREIPARKWHAAMAQARGANRPAQAAQLEDAYVRLRQVAAWGVPGSDPGTPEPMTAELDPDSEVPSSFGTARVAEVLDCSERWVRKLIAMGDLSAIRVSGRWVIDQESLIEYRDTKEQL